MNAAPDRRVTPWRGDLAAAALRGTVAADRYAEGEPAEVVAASAPLRERPDDGARLASEALHGERFTVYETAAGWAWGQLETDRYVGYLPAAALAPPGPPATHRVAALRTYLYPEADLKSPPRALLSLNALVAAAGIDGEFVRLAGGGFVHCRHVAPIGEAAADFVAVARRFVGTPYLWGGRTSLGLDCSALVQMALIAVGIACPRDSDLIEAAVGEPVPHHAAPGRLDRGDLVFWPGHVGIMADREVLIHANAHHMETVVEPFAEAAARIAGLAGPPRSVRRLAR